MKKFFSMMMIAVAAFGFAACEPSDGNDQTIKGKLATPELTETHTETSITVTWGKVEHAESYVVLLTGGDGAQTTQDLSYTFENLNAGDYNVRVVAKAEGYEDSDAAKITVTLTGATSVDWFTQTLSLPVEGGETIETQTGTVTYMPYNTVKARWEGTGVADIKYALFETAVLDGVTDAQIKENLTTPDDVAGWCAEINTEGGLELLYGPGLSGSTSYTAYVMVTNEDGLEFFTKNEITTSGFDIPAETQAWIGTWNAKTSQVISINDKGVGTLSAKNETFTLTIAASTTAPDTVVIDGLSVLGDGNPTVGYVEKNTLTILTNFSIGADASGVTYMWLPYVAVDGQLLGLNNFGGEVPAHTLTMAEDGTVTGETGKFGVRFEDNTEGKCEVVCTELYGVDQNGQLYFFIESFPAVYRAGAMELTKAATPTAKVLNKEVVNYPMSLSSVVF